MVMGRSVKNRIRTNNRRTLARSVPRFLSLMIMSMLGTLVFAGLTATAPDMLKTLDCYLDSASVYDLRVVSDMGLEEADVVAISNLEGVSCAEGGCSLDVLTTWGSGETAGDAVINITSMPGSLNTITLCSGRFPEAPDEIVVEENLLTKEGCALGESLTLDSKSVVNSEVTIVGTVNSALYYNNVMLDQNRGNTGVGSGKISYYAYMPRENYDMDCYTVVWLTADGAADAVTADEEYVRIVDEVNDRLEGIRGARTQARYDSIYAQASAELEDAETAANDELNRAWQELEDAKQTLDTTKAQLDSAKEELTEAEQQLSAMEAMATTAAYAAVYEAARESYESGLAEYEQGLADYEAGMQSYEDGLAEYNEARAEADLELAEAREALDEIEMPRWYIYDRTGYSTYNDYVDDAGSIRNLARLFPVVFFAVAVLISLISMNRMVEDDRLEIGTLKSLGFENRMIISKYLSFSLWATITGGILGSAIGLVVIPELINNIYRILFTLPSLELGLHPGTTLLGFFVTVICVCGTGTLTAWKVLREKPTELMRGKAPKAGSRVLAERIPLIWNRLSFSRKVTVRNLFRYKKRVLITVGGIAGCAALMLSGFGVKDAIVDVPSAQYYDIYRFDGTAFVTDLEAGTQAEGAEGAESAENALTLKDFTQREEISSAAPALRRTATIEGINGYMLVLAPEDLGSVAAFTDAQDGTPLTLQAGSVIINEKLSAMTGLGAGDTISFTDVDQNTFTMTIGGVAKNYIEHFVYMTREDYESVGEAFTPNLVYFNTNELDEQKKDALAAALLEDEQILNLTYRDTLIENVDNSLKSLNSVVLILIVLSALLDFVVLYNLSNINISERRRELSTLKVLGFYDSEVDRYINAETLIMTIAGIVLGLVLGIVLSHLVVNTIEIEKCRFINELKPMSYVYTALMTTFFTLIVAALTHRSLRRINMIDSLKSVE